MINKALMLILMFLIIPEFLGLLVLCFSKKEKYNIFLALVVGYFIEFGIIEVTTVYAIYSSLSLTFVVDVVSKVSIALAIISFILNIRNVLGIIKELFKSMIEAPKILAIVAILLVVFQTYMPVKYAHTDDDDSYYVAVASTAIYTDTLMKIDPATGNETKAIITKYALAPYWSITAIVGKIASFHAPTVAHYILPAVFIPLVYILYFQIGKELFKDDNKKPWLFLIFVSVLYIYGKNSPRNNFTFLFFRAWQGKAILANFAIPAAILFTLKTYKNDCKFIYYLLMFLISFGSTLTTSMAIGFVPITIMALTLAIEITEYDKTNRKKFFLNLIKSGICCIPCLANGIAFLLLK